MLVGIQMDTVDPARGGDRARIKEIALQGIGDIAISRRQTHTFGVTSHKLRRDRPLGGLDRRGSDHQNGRDRHPRFNGGLSDGPNENGDPLGHMPRRVGMHRLKIVCAQHQDHQVDWAMGLQDGWQDCDPVLVHAFDVAGLFDKMRGQG